MKILKTFENIETFRKLDFSIFKGISLIFEKSCFRKFSTFSKKLNFQKSKKIRDSTLTNFNFRSRQRIFDFFDVLNSLECQFSVGTKIIPIASQKVQALLRFVIQYFFWQKNTEM